MARFRVTVYRTDTYRRAFEIEAPNEGQARMLAELAADEAPLDSFEYESTDLSIGLPVKRLGDQS